MLSKSFSSKINHHSIRKESQKHNMEAPEKKEKPRPKISPVSENNPDSNISLTRKILIGIFILGFWVYFYWFRGT
tara:strand:+ start:635 stop:859 length:225 start_codon:yes stop_codon:yes gene_type:complete